jgi:hypothetical protein
MLKSLILFALISSFSNAQSFEYAGSIGKFDNASSFYITANGFIYVCDSGRDEVVMLDTLGKISISFGGYGWSENSFDDPSDVFADPLTIYVADKNNHKIKRFDKNLNYLYSLYTLESDNSVEQFAYPLSCATSNQGDLYLLDSDSKRIMKFDIYGKFIQNFGGFDAGKYQLSNPSQLAISSANNIYVIDGKKIFVFDHFGNGISIINADLKLNSIRILFDNLIVCSEEEIFFSNLRLPEIALSQIKLSGLDNIPAIVSAFYFNNKLYVLTSGSILIFCKIN